MSRNRYPWPIPAGDRQVTDAKMDAEARRTGQVWGLVFAIRGQRGLHYSALTTSKKEALEARKRLIPYHTTIRVMRYDAMKKINEEDDRYGRVARK